MCSSAHKAWRTGKSSQSISRWKHGHLALEPKGPKGPNHLTDLTNVSSLPISFLCFCCAVLRHLCLLAAWLALPNRSLDVKHALTTKWNRGACVKSCQASDYQSVFIPRFWSTASQVVLCCIEHAQWIWCLPACSMCNPVHPFPHASCQSLCIRCNITCDPSCGNVEQSLGGRAWWSRRWLLDKNIYGLSIGFPVWPGLVVSCEKHSEGIRHPCCETVWDISVESDWGDFLQIWASPRPPTLAKYSHGRVWLQLRDRWAGWSIFLQDTAV